MVSVVQWSCIAVAVIMGLVTLAKHLTGRVTSARRVTFDNVTLFWHYTVAQGIVGLLLVHFFPRMMGAQ